MRIGLMAVLVGVVALLAYVRLAPSDAARWHVDIDAAGDADMAGGVVRVVPGDPALLGRADAYMRALPRTRVLAGSVAEGHVTYVTRTRVFGFPDYTTLQYDAGAGLLKAFARLRFGASDMGVNAKRLAGLIAALK